MALVAYGALVTTMAAGLLSGQESDPAIAMLIGASVPGAGFLHWAQGPQCLAALLLCGGGLIAFAAALVLWFATGNVIAPVAAWGLLAWLSGRPALFGLDPNEVADWPSQLGPAGFVLLAIGWLRHGVRDVPARPYAAAIRPDDRQPEPPPELSPETLQRLRLLLDRAQQPAARFDGFERRDQFQTAALRYQVNFVAYALASAAHHHAPAADAPFAAAQAGLLAKIGDRRLWRYWRLENAWGNLRLGADPIARQNIMYSGFTALQMALAEADRLTLHEDGREWRGYDLDQIAGLLEDQYRASRFGLLACEPNWLYPLCNIITLAAIKAADARLGTRRWSPLADRFLNSLQREGTRADGSFIAFRSTLTGLAPPSPGGIVMQAFPCLFLNALSPELAQEHWRCVRRRLDSEAWPRLFWPVDVGNYGFSRASSYAATAAAAVEMGDRPVAEECLRRLEQECPSHQEYGAIHRKGASLWAHALEAMALCGRQNGLADMVASPAAASPGPRLLRTSCAKLHVAGALARDGGLDLVFQPGGGRPSAAVEIGGLVPGRHYRTEGARWPLLQADRDGRGVVCVPIAGRTPLSIRPLGEEVRPWSAA